MFNFFCYFLFYLDWGLSAFQQPWPPHTKKAHKNDPKVRRCRTYQPILKPRNGDAVVKCFRCGLRCLRYIPPERRRHKKACGAYRRLGAEHGRVLRVPKCIPRASTNETPSTKGVCKRGLQDVYPKPTTSKHTANAMEVLE